MSFISDVGDFLGGNDNAFDDNGGGGFSFTGSDLAGLIQAGGALYGYLNQDNSGSNATNKALKNQGAYAAAIANPNDPTLKALTAQIEPQYLADYATGLRQMIGDQQRARARGLYTVNPERRDEALFQAMGSARENSGEIARDRARQYLATAAGLNTQISGLANTAQVNQLIQNQQLGNVIGAGGDLAGLLFDRLNGSPDQTINLNYNGRLNPVVNN